MLVLSVTGKTFRLDIEPETPMLWVLRDELVLTGTKFRGGVAECGACTNGEATRSSQFSAGEAVGKKFVTIEGIGEERLHISREPGSKRMFRNASSDALCSPRGPMSSPCSTSSPTQAIGASPSPPI